MREDFQLLLTGDGRVSRDRSVANAPVGAQALIQVDVVGICATDVALFRGGYQAPHRSPVCFGHEWAGTVIDVGPGARRVSPGNRVTGECSLWCGVCDRCHENRNLCRQVEKFGITTDGAARSKFLIEDKYLHRAPNSLDPAILALAEPLAVSARGIQAAECDDLASQRILIIGGGMIGLGCLILLKTRSNASEIFLHDIERSRLARAVALGARTLPSGVSTCVQAPVDYANLYDLDGFDLVIETTGAEAAFRQAIALANPRATVVLMGFTPSLAFPARELVMKNIRIAGSIGGSDLFETVVPWLEDNTALLRQLIGHTFPADAAEQAFDAAQDRRTAPKIQLRWSA